jgi:predicted DCC family thiol-disulfide oxidoreductase YuxK
MARWPLRTIQWLLVLAYLSAGLSKLIVGGLQWFDGHTLSYYLMRDSVRWGSEVAMAAAEQTELLAVLSVGTVGFELTFALAVLVPVLAWPYVLVGGALHTGIYILQRAPFFQYLALYVVLIEPLRRYWPVRRRSPERLSTVVYDGLCPRCIRTMVTLDYLDVTGKLVYLDLERDWPQVARLDPTLTLEGARHSMLVVAADGTVHRGYHAFRALARIMPALWPVLPVFHLPLAGRIGPSIYDRLAARRLRIQCTPEVCGAHQARRGVAGVTAT